MIYSIDLQVAKLNLACKVELYVLMEIEELAKINNPDRIQFGDQRSRFILNLIKEILRSQSSQKFVDKFGSSKKNCQSSMEFLRFDKIHRQIWFSEEKSTIPDGVFGVRRNSWTIWFTKENQ
jgi:streptogramin lyase